MPATRERESYCGLRDTWLWLPKSGETRIWEPCLNWVSKAWCWTAYNVCVCARQLSNLSQTSWWVGKEVRLPASGVGPQVRELRVLGLSNWGRPGSRGQLWGNPMLRVYLKLQPSSDGEEREDEKVCAVHIYVKAICVDVGSGIGPSHCAVCVVGHVCIVCVVCLCVCVCVTIGNTCSTSLVAGHRDMELREPCLCRDATREVLKSIRFICFWLHCYTAHAAAPVWVTHQHRVVTRWTLL